MPERYEPASFEAKWRDRWNQADLFKTREDEGRPKYYALDFFPYPSGAGLSVGHCRNYIPTDVLARFKYMQGYNVLHPMGFDAFGLPAENEAIKRKSHPAPMIDQYAATYQRQLTLVGISYDWSRSFKSSDPSYYRWTQWIFKILYDRGLAYQKMAAVNWDPIDKTVLADEEIIGGRAERSGAIVEKKFIPQWFFKITDYAQRLIDDLEDIDWPEGIKNQQRNWIGRSEGVEFEMRVDASGEVDGSDFHLKEKPLTFRVFTTRIDTVFGMTFCVLAPEHPVVDAIAAKATEEFRSAIAHYREEAKLKSDTERTAVTKEKSGCFTGAYAINPATGSRVPIYIADYVLITYGTGAIMAVPGHDQRDFDFAKQFGIEIKAVVAPDAAFLDKHSLTEQEYIARIGDLPEVFDSKDSTLLQSGEYTGMSVSESQAKLGEWVEALGIGERKIQYKLRDWLISRQRYWGCPIPIIHNADGTMGAVTEECLPVELPTVDHYEPSGDGTSPLAAIPDFVNVTDANGTLGRRETDTMGGFACSSWYFLRFCDPLNDDAAWDPTKLQRWMPVDCYVGGAEHAVMHLLYARFWTKVLYDAGLVPVKEPFATLRNQGQVLALTPYRYPREDERLAPGDEGILVSFAEAETLTDDQKFYRWARMSKSKGNVVTPEEAVEKYGADALRVYELFVAPFEADVQWTDEGANGAVKFLHQTFKLINDLSTYYIPEWKQDLFQLELTGEASSPGVAKIRRATHQAISRVTDHIERFSFNTYISSMMIYKNRLVDLQRELSSPTIAEQRAFAEAVETMIVLLAPAAPHSADELWESLGQPGYTYHLSWPSFDPELAKEDEIAVAVQVNGKLRDTMSLPADTSDDDLQAAALASEKVQQHLEGKTIRKVIVVPKKLVNIVAN